MPKKSIKKCLLNLHCKGLGAITRSDSCRVLKTVHFGIGDISKCWMDDHFVKIFVFFTIWSTNGSLLGVHQWFLWVNQWFLWVNQWFPCWGEPMAPLFGWTGGSLVGEDQNHFPPAGGLPQALFFGQKLRFRWKNDVFAFYKGCQQSYREPFINFLALLGHSQRKSWFYHFFQKIFKKDIFLEISVFHSPDFSLGNFHDF